MSSEVLGHLTDEEKSEFSEIKRQKEALYGRIAQIEVEKFRLSNMAISLDGRGQSLAMNITKRLGLEPNTPWSANDQGEIVKP
jgi:hypothetical protein